MSQVEGKPRVARSMAGWTRSAHGSRPRRWCASHRPATVPGTPTARMPSWLELSRISPASSRYIVSVAARGAFSRKSKVVTAPSAPWKTRKPPPPTLPAAGRVTARANATATAASTALPPWRSTASPASEAR